MKADKEVKEATNKDKKKACMDNVHQHKHATPWTFPNRPLNFYHDRTVIGGQAQLNQKLQCKLNHYI